MWLIVKRMKAYETKRNETKQKKTTPKIFDLLANVFILLSIKFSRAVLQIYKHWNIVVDILIYSLESASLRTVLEMFNGWMLGDGYMIEFIFSCIFFFFFIYFDEEDRIICVLNRLICTNMLELCKCKIFQREK